MYRKKLMICLIAVLVLSGSVLIARSGYFYARGVFSQFLLNNAWEESKIKKEIIKVWDGMDIYPAGKLSIRSINLSNIILNNADNESLALGPAQISSSAKPGSGGNIAIAGHRDSFFRNLEFVKRGEIIELESIHSVQYYLITDIQIIDPQDTRWIEDTKSNVITLITCYPFEYVGSAPQRYVVRGKLIKSRD